MSTGTKRDTFGPSALLTPANLLTIVRLLATPVFVCLVVFTGPSTWLLASLWLVSAGSDGVDGYIARRQGATTSGAFLDPLADKILVLGVLASLASIGEIGWVAVSLIAAREVAMSVFRVYAARRGVSVPARRSAKLKTLLQDVVVGLALLPPVGLHHADIVRDLLWAAVAVTIYTGLEYANDARRHVAPAGPASV
jgi:CDP-diacylglycerol--glycerol-3-phosphate 3-phosphatidyltransferase